MDDRRLDGNAAGGMLREIFAFDITTAETLCAGCGARDQVGALAVYADAPGTIVRCTHCDCALIRVVHGGGRYWLDLRGLICLEFNDLSNHQKE